MVAKCILTICLLLITTSYTFPSFGQLHATICISIIILLAIDFKNNEHMKTKGIMLTILYLASSSNAVFYQSLRAPDPATNQNYGSAVAVFNNTAFVGAKQDNFPIGSAYVLRKNTTNQWQQLQKLAPSDSGGGFGESLSFDGENNVLIVGALRHNNYRGAVYIFTETNGVWAEHQILTPSITQSYCGTDVAISKNVIVIGCPFDETMGYRNGAIYVYEYDAAAGNWSQAAEVFANDFINNDNFGGTVDIDDGVIVAGSRLWGADPVYQGAAYIIEKDATFDTWNITHRLAPTVASGNAMFGAAVSIDSATNTIAVGADWALKVYIFQYNSSATAWMQKQAVASNDSNPGDSFGLSVAVGNNVLFVGAYYNDAAGSNSGAGYVWEYDATVDYWIFTTNIQPNVANGQAGFQQGVAVYGNTLIIGTRTDSSIVSGAGSVHIYEREGEGSEWIATQTPTNAPSTAPTQPPTTCLDVSGDLSNEEKGYVAREVLLFNVSVSSEQIISAVDAQYLQTDVFLRDDEQQQLECSGSVSCFQSIIEFRNNSICNILCNSTLSCFKAEITMIGCTAVDVICDGDQSCDGSKLSIQAGAETIRIQCGDSTSCQNMEIDISGNASTSISCVDYNSCENIDIKVEDHRTTFLTLYASSENILFDNGYGWQSEDGSSKYIDCQIADKSIPWRENMNDTQIRAQISRQYDNITFPCSSVTVGCIGDLNDSQSTASCVLGYDVSDSYYVPTPTLSPLDCYYVRIQDIIEQDCYGTCFLSPTEDPTAAPSNAPTAPTSQPSMAPTAEPTIDPSTAPTISPSQTPTYSPSKSPTLTPTAAPTATPTYSPSPAPTRTPTTDSDKLYDTKCDIVYKMQNMDDADVDFLENNAMTVVPYIVAIIESNYFVDQQVEYVDFMVSVNDINGVEVGKANLEYNEDITMDCTIFCTEEIGNTLVIKSKANTFSEQVTADLRHFFNPNNESNPDVDVNAYGDEGGLLFVVDNKETLKAVTDEQFDEDPNYFVIGLSIGIIVSGLIISLIAKWLNTKKSSKSDNSKWYVPLLFALQIYDFISDINLCFEILTNPLAYVGEEKFNIILMCGFASVFFTVVPYLTNLLYGIRIHSQETIKNNRRADEYFADRIFVFVALIVISGGCHPALLMVSSRLFNLYLFDCGLTKHELNELSKIKMKSTICLENLPQLLIQIIYAVQVDTITPAIVGAFIGSVLSIIMTSSTYYANKLALKDADIVSYYLKFSNTANNGALSQHQQDQIENNKARKEALQKSIAQQFQSSPESIEIGFVTTIVNGIEMHVSHYIPKSVLDQFNQKFNARLGRAGIYRIDVEPKHYIAELYKKHANGLNDSCRQHFGINDACFMVQYINPNDATDIDVDIGAVDIGQTQMNSVPMNAGMHRMFAMMEGMQKQIQDMHQIQGIQQNQNQKVQSMQTNTMSQHLLDSGEKKEENDIFQEIELEEITKVNQNKRDRELEGNNDNQTVAKSKSKSANKSKIKSTQKTKPKKKKKSKSNTKNR